MTFNEWVTDHIEKVSDVIERLKPKNNKELITYFDYENMVKNEPDFCPLYKMGKKCHDSKELNCYYCACPYFEESDDEPFGYNGGIKIMSKCNINSTKAGTFIQDGVQQCDCTNCFIPHKAKFALKHLEKENDNN